MPPIEAILGQALADAFKAMDIDIAAQDIQLVRPSRREHGDWTSNIAMQAATATGRKPRELAEEIIARAPVEHLDGGNALRQAVGQLPGPVGGGERPSGPGSTGSCWPGW